MTSRQEAVCFLVLPSIKVPLGFQNKHAPLAFEKFPRPPSHTTSQLFGHFIWKSNIPLTCTASRLLISHWECMRWFPRRCCGRQVFSFSPKWWLPWFQCFRRAWLEVIEEMLLGYYLIPCLYPPSPTLHPDPHTLLPPSSCHVAPEHASYPLETFKPYFAWLRLGFEMNFGLIIITEGFLPARLSCVFTCHFPRCTRGCVFFFFIEKVWQHISLISLVFFHPAFHGFDPVDVEGKLRQKQYLEARLGIQFISVQNFTAARRCRQIVNDL